MRVVVFGNREIGCVCLEELLAMGVEVPLVVTYPRDPNESPGFRVLKEVAEARGLPVVTPPDASGRPLLDWVREVRPDLVLSFYYGHRIPRTVRGVPRLGAFNLHGALLPRWRGRAPLPWVLLEGETECGVTLHEMVEAMDAGPIVGQVRFPVAGRETVTTLYAKTLAASRVLLRQTVPLLLAGRAPRAPQDASKATVTPPLASRRDLALDASVERLDRTVRALTHPYHGARVDTGAGRVLIWEGEPGEHPDGLVLALADGPWTARRLSVEGGPELDAAAFRAAHPDRAAALIRHRD